MPSNVKLGRLPRSFKPTLPFGALLATEKKQLPPIPTNLNYGTSITNWGVMRNDELGDCTAAAPGHGLQVWTKVCRNWEVTEPDDKIVQLYSETGGYRIGDPSTDNGANMQNVAQHLQKVGMPITPVDGRDRHKILGWLETDHRNLDDVRRAIFVGGGAYIGFEVPAFVMQSTAHVWDDRGNGQDTRIIGGHAIWLTGYDAQGFHLVSWGDGAYYMTDAFFRKYVDEVYLFADPSWIDFTGRTPANMTKQAFLDVLTQGFGS